MKHLYKLIMSVFVITLAAPQYIFAQQEVTIRDLHTYDVMPTNQTDLGDHPLAGVEVTFDAVVVSYPKNSGLASITSAGVPGRIHVFVTDVNAVEMGEAGMSLQLVVEGAQRETLEGLNRGDVISVVGTLTYFSSGANAQFDATEVSYLGSVQGEFTELAELLEPEVIELTDINIPAQEEGRHTWNAENYTTYIHRYVKIEGLEVIDRTIDEDGRPWFILSDGTTILSSNDTSLRFRNDRGEGYAYDPVEGEGLGYNWRRLDESLDGPFTPPPPGSIVDVAGYLVYNDFDPGGFDVSSVQSTLKIAPWDDGVVWTADGTDPENRLTPEGWPNDLVVRGFAPVTDNFSATPETVTSSDQVTVSIDVDLPEEDYTLNSVVIQFSDYPYTADSGDTTEVAMTANGNTYSYTFDSFDEFTTVNYTIIATAETPDGIETRARQSGSFFVESTTQTSPVVFSPSAEGDYNTSVTVSLSSQTENATIYYTLDGTDPDETSTEYSEPLSFFQNTTIKAIAVADGLEDSPISTRSYVIIDNSTSAGTLAEIRDGEIGDLYRYTGDAVVTYTHSNRNQIFLMDASGGLLIDDPDNIITSTYEIGDVMTGLLGEVSGFGGLPQFVPLADPGDPTETAAVEPVDLTLADLDPAQHKSMLVRVEDVTFTDRKTGTFVASEDYEITDPSLGEEETMLFRTNFGGADYIGEEIPEDPFTMTAIVGFYVENLQLTPRNAADMGMTVSNENEMPHKFALEQNYPNPFNPTTNINFTLPQASDVQLTVYNVLGQQVAQLVNGRMTAGTHTVTFNASDLASGMYLYRIKAGSFVQNKRMMLIK